jgi:hypothetical protein
MLKNPGMEYKVATLAFISGADVFLGLTKTKGGSYA